MPIDFCVIPPLSNLPLMNQGRRIFALGQLCLRHPHYLAFIEQKVKENWFVILDSGVGDHNDFVDSPTLVALTELIMPSEVIALDVLFDAEKTIESFENFVELMSNAQLLGKVKLQFVPQGKTQAEWLACYEYGLNHPLVDTIGMSKLSVPQCFDGKWDKDQNIMQARHKCYDHLLANDLIQKPLHFLGAGNVIEFLHYKHKQVRSTDSCFSVLAAINKLNWKSGQTTRIPTPSDYFLNYSLPERDYNIFADNVEVLANACGFETR